jgi:hypothetical protein
MPIQGGLSVERMCELARVSRAGYYRSLQERAPREEEVEVRSVIQRIALEHRRRYGYRRGGWPIQAVLWLEWGQLGGRKERTWLGD